MSNLTPTYTIKRQNATHINLLPKRTKTEHIVPTAAVEHTPNNIIQSPLIILVLDSSGSMESIATDIRNAVNKFIKQQKEGPVDGTRFSFIVFSNNVNIKFIKKPLVEVQDITVQDYECYGSTALFDAIGVAIDRHADEKEALMVVVTDGEENSSVMSHSTMVGKVDAMKAIGWKFIYLANEPRVSRVGASIGVHSAAEGAQYSDTNNVSVGYERMSQVLERAVSDAVQSYRSTSQVPNLNGV